ncbi:hypothetical protein [Mesorhizobium xinjiangense]|uniref:hypothetical protein n=1 Tax=Mesorhizobium xinjiangense TaxID=2678685 RepID=UPI0012ED1140|nr:hypothetical protein [Mesorhizobium xinjiangense]
MKHLLILAGALGLSLSAAQACDFHKTAHGEKNMSVASSDVEPISTPDKSLTTASIVKPDSERPAEAPDD